jgi:hypothetical protein
MPRNHQPAIEVEVLEIDGSTPPPPRPPPDPLADDDAQDDSRSGQSWTNWQRWPGQVRMLHPLWWPVLIVGGGILLAVFLTIGLCAAALLVIYRIVRGLLRGLGLR